MEERVNLLRNRDEMEMVNKSLEEGYCDVSGRVGDLDYIGQSLFNVFLFTQVSDGLAGSMSDVKVYVSKGELPWFAIC